MPNFSIYLSLSRIVKTHFLSLYIHCLYIILSHSLHPYHLFFSLSLSLHQKSAPCFVFVFFSLSLFLSANSGGRDKGTDSQGVSKAMEEDWDLQAVVRGCVSTASRATTTTSTVTTTTTAAATTSFLPDFHSNYSYFSRGNQQQEVGQGQGQGQGRLFSFSDPFEVRHVSEDLHELCKPFFLKPQPLSPQLSPLITPFSNSLSSFAVSKAQTPPPPQQQQQTQHHQQQQQKQQPRQSQSASNTNQKSKRR